MIISALSVLRIHKYMNRNNLNLVLYFSKVNKPLLPNNSRAFGSVQKSVNTFLPRLQEFRIFHKGIQTSNIKNESSKANKIANNVVLYKYDRTFLYHCATIFSVVQLVCLWTAASNIYTVYYNEMLNSYGSLSEKIGTLVVPAGLFCVLAIAGPAFFSIIWFFTRRSIKYVFLLKGGNRVQFVTYHPLKGEEVAVFPLDKITCVKTRSDSAGYIKIVVKDKSFFYIVDRKGSFPNAQLFDQTVGVNRKI